MEKAERNQEIFNLYRNGISQAEISRRYGLSRGLVQNIIKKKKEKDNQAFQGLSVRANNCLTHYGIESPQQLSEIIGKYGLGFLWFIRNCGKGTSDEIAEYAKKNRLCEEKIEFPDVASKSDYEQLFEELRPIWQKKFLDKHRGAIND